MLKFSKQNAKLVGLNSVPELQVYLQNRRKVYSFDLLSGWSCPFANECFSKVVIDENNKRKIQDGENTKFRCFSASQEVQYTNTYNMRANNFAILRKLNSPDDMAKALNNVMPANLGICRIHVAGDFFNAKYFQAWIKLALNYPDRLFYAYTKSLPYWIENIENIPYNLVLTASLGGRHDDKIDKYNLRAARVVFSENEAYHYGLDIDHDDSHAARPSLRDEDFALLIHGTQPANTEASNAIKTLKANGIRFSYSR